MEFFGKKKDFKELKLPEAPTMMFPELPQEKEEYQESGGESSIPDLPQIQELSANLMPATSTHLKNLQKINFSNNDMMPLLNAKMPEANIPSVKNISRQNLGHNTEKNKANNPMFIKIDRYKESMANFELIKKRLQETSSLLERIKETRKEEERELNSWAQEMETIKTKIDSIDKKMFNSLD